VIPVPEESEKRSKQSSEIPPEDYRTVKTDWYCPDCGTGFPKAVGRRNFERRFTRFRINEIQFYDIICPECGHVFAGNEAGEKHGDAADPNFANVGTGDGGLVILLLFVVCTLAALFGVASLADYLISVIVYA
jgi:rubredoxin